MKVNQLRSWGFISLLLFLFYGCSEEAVVKEVAEGTESVSFAPCTIKVSYGDVVDSRMGYGVATNGLAATWQSGDKLLITDKPYQSSTTYVFNLTDGAGTSTGTFTCENFPTTTSSYYWTVFYPADKVTSDKEFCDFIYEGQKQTGNGSIAHLTQYHAMRYQVPVTQSSTLVAGQQFIESFTLSGENFLQSSCIKFKLSGFSSAITPKEISLMVVDNNNYPRVSLPLNGNAGSCLTLDGAEPQINEPSVSRLKLDLENITINQGEVLEAYMMMSNSSFALGEGIKFRVTVTDNAGKKYYADKEMTSDFTFESGRFHTITITGGWTENNKYVSTDYTEDGKSGYLYQGNQTNKTDLIIMGDGFVDTDMNDNNYKAKMQKACDNFFSIYPYSALKEYFDVYYIKAVSENQPQYNVGLSNGATGSGSVTKFSSRIVPNSTNTSGDNNLVLEYAKKALKETGNYTDAEVNARIQNALMLVIINQENVYAGTCTMVVPKDGDYGKGHSIAYLPLGKNESDFKYTLIHEAGGHGFGKLADEYQYTMQTFNYLSTEWNDLKNSHYDAYGQVEPAFHTSGLYRNIDKYWSSDYNSTTGFNFDATNDDAVLWAQIKSDYSTDTRETIGVYPGAYTYDIGFCRPSENSVMRHQSAADGQYFNAVCRWIIYYRLMRLTGRTDTQEQLYTEFKSWDSQNAFTKTDPTMSSTISSNAAARSLVVDEERAHTPPVLIRGHWENGYFIREQ